MDPDLQRIDVKILAEVPADFSLDPFLAIFSRWRKDEDESDWIDLADYAHMATGAGIMLIGKQGSFSVNLDHPGIGLLYSGRKDFAGSFDQRLLEAFRRCLRLTKPLLAEPDFPQQLKLHAGSWEIFVNDRLNYPNTEATGRQLRESLESALNLLFGAGSYAVEYDPDPQRRFAVSVRAPNARIEQLFEKTSAVLK